MALCHSPWEIIEHFSASVVPCASGNNNLPHLRMLRALTIHTCMYCIDTCMYNSLMAAVKESIIYEEFSTGSSQQMEDSPLTTTTVAVIFKHSFVKLRTSGLCRSSLHVLHMVLGSLSHSEDISRAESQRFRKCWLPNGTSRRESITLSPGSQIHVYCQLVPSQPKVLPLPANGP